MEFKGKFLFVHALFVFLCTTDTVHVDLEEILENQQDQAVSSTTTPAQYSNTYSTTDSGIDAEQSENETIAEEHVHKPINGSHVHTHETSLGHVKKTGSEFNTSEINTGHVKKNVSTEALPSPKSLAAETVPKSLATQPSPKSLPAENAPTLLDTPADHIKSQDRPVLWFKHNLTPERCTYGQDGECGTIRGLVCRLGTTCMFKISNPESRGKCCVNKSMNEQCPYGEDGECGSVHKLVCRSGTTCMFKGNYTDAGGKCCIDKPEEKFCPSGVIGPSCQVSQDCKPRYTCRFGNCCRDKLCPAGWIEGDACSTQAGLLKCRKGFQCINGSCCGVPDNFCPSGVVGPVCSEKSPCTSGYSCRFGYCCRNKRCPNGMIKGGLCNTQPGKPKCRKGFQCITDICCQPRNIFKVAINVIKPKKNGKVPNPLKKAINTAPRTDFHGHCNGEPVGKCGGVSDLRCPPNSRCVIVNVQTAFGVCCRKRKEPVCLNGYVGTCGGKTARKCPFGATCKYVLGNTEGLCCKNRPSTVSCHYGTDGVCGTILGLKCREGTTCRLFQTGVPEAGGKCCINNPREAFCPSGVVSGSCTSREPCKLGYTCRYGFCCRNSGVLNLI